jgi:hypothetical protein
MSLGIKIDLDDPGCPYQNGGHERMHRDMKQELQGKINGNLRDHQKEFDRWRKEFNEVRPHEGLGMKRPKEVYKKSQRLWKGKEEEQEYNGKMKVRIVNDRVFFNLRQRRIFIRSVTYLSGQKCYRCHRVVSVFISPNVPAVYDVLAVRIRTLRSKDRAGKMWVEVCRGNGTQRNELGVAGGRAAY